MRPPLASRLLWASCLLLPLLWASPSLPYVRSITSKSKKPLRWLESNCVILRLNGNGSDNVTDDSELEAVKQAAKNWEEATAECSFITFIFREESKDVKPGFDPASSENENVIFWEERSWPKEKDPKTAALTTISYIDKPDIEQDGQILDADIELNGVNYKFATTGAANVTDVENTVTHEMGHMMGLDHPCDDSGGKRNPMPVDDTGKPPPSCYPVEKLSEEMRLSTMFNFTEPGDTDKRTPEEDDVRGVCAIYPKSKDPGVCSPPKYDFDSGGCGVCPGAACGASWPTSLMLLSLLGLSLLLAARRTR